jgi:hypothetical protein
VSFGDTSDKRTWRVAAEARLLDTRRLRAANARAVHNGAPSFTDEALSDLIDNGEHLAILALAAQGTEVVVGCLLNIAPATDAIRTRDGRKLLPVYEDLAATDLGALGVDAGEWLGWPVALVPHDQAEAVRSAVRELFARQIAKPGPA